MACLKCGSPTKDGETLCEKCVAEAKEFENQSSQPIAEETVQPVTEINTEENKPNKKKVNKAVIAVACVVAVLIGTFSVIKLFFNRDFSQLIMGKSKYAQNVELLTAKESVNHIMGSVNSYQNLAVNSNKNVAVESTATYNVKYDDKLLKNMPAEQAEKLEQLCKYLNSLKINQTIGTCEKGMKSNIVITDPASLLFSIDSSIYNNGKSYVRMRKIWDQYLMLPQLNIANINSLNAFNLKIDSTKLKASLEKLAVIYSQAIVKADVKTEDNQSVTIDGATVQGQKLTASLDEAKTTAMITQIAKAIKSDDYLYTLVSENDSKKLTKADYEKLIDDTIAKLENINSTFSAISYLAPNGTLLAHSYVVKRDSNEIKLNFLISDKKYAVEINFNNQGSIIMSNTKSGENSGNVQVKFQQSAEPKNLGINIAYSNVKKVKLFGEESTTGKCEITLYDPNHFISNQLAMYGISEALGKLDQLKLTMELSPNGEEKANGKVQITIPEFVTVDATGTMSLKKETIEMPEEPRGGQVTDIEKMQSQDVQQQLSRNILMFLSSSMENNPELTTVLSYFGITKESLEMFLTYGGLAS